MENCLLCLELKQEFVGTILINSKQWDELNIKNVLIKYLWPMSHMKGNSWICTTCWTELYEFHKFYMRIEDAHRNLGLLTTNVTEVEEVSNNEETATNEIAKTSINELVEYPIEILMETRADELKDFLNENEANCNELQNIKADKKPLLKLEFHEESIFSNNSLPKRKRGRPRKNNSNDADAAKRDYKCNDTDVSRGSSTRRNLGLLTTMVAKDPSNNEEGQEETNEISKTPINELVEEYPIEILMETRAVELKDFLNETDTSDQLQNVEVEKRSLKLGLHEHSLICNNSLAKRKRGRPRKRNSSDTDVATDDFKYSDTNISRDSSKKAEKRKKTKCNKIRYGESDIVAENTSSHVKNLKTNFISVSAEKHVNSSSESDGEYSDQVEMKSNSLPKSVSKEKDKFIADNFKITCHLCDIPFETFYNVRKHFEVEHKQRGHIECCNRKFYRRNMLLDHVHYHMNPNYFKCTKCDKSFEDRRRLDVHIKTHEINNGKNHFCDVCGKGFLILAILNKHKLIHVPEDEKRFECSECGKKFATNHCLKSHYRYTHLKKYIKICDTCGKAIRDKDVFKRHMMQHEGKSERVSCDVCGLLLTDEKALKRHKEVIHPVGGQKKYTCSICSKTSPNFRAHKLHVQFKHETGYNYKCTICDKTFKKAPSLKEHMASHTGTTLYTCPWCPKTFNSSANMHHHRKRIHPKEWEETSRKRYSGKLPPYFKPPTTTESTESIVTLDTQ